MFKRFDQQSLVMELLKRHARISIVHRETGVSRQLLRKTYRELHGCSPSPGALKYSTQGLTRNLKHYKEVTLFAVCFQTVDAQSQADDIRKIIMAFDSYKQFCPASPLDFSAAWVIARDVKAMRIKVAKCPHCGAAVLLQAREAVSEHCGVCKASL